MYSSLRYAQIHLLPNHVLDEPCKPCKRVREHDLPGNGGTGGLVGGDADHVAAPLHAIDRRHLAHRAASYTHTLRAQHINNKNGNYLRKLDNCVDIPFHLLFLFLINRIVKLSRLFSMQIL